MKKILCSISMMAISSAFAGQVEVPFGKKPGNAPTKHAIQITEKKLDCLAFKTEEHIGIRVRNGKHKMGARTITINLGNVDLLVQRVDITKPIAEALKSGNGQHLMDTFSSNGKIYEIFYTVKNGKIAPKLIVKSK